MFYYGFCLQLLVVAIVAQAFPGRSVQDEPKRCCVPQQFSSVMSTSSGVVLPGGQPEASYVSDDRYSIYMYEIIVFFKGTYNFSYDTTRKLVGMQGVSYSPFDSKKSNIRIIENITDGSILTFDEDTKQCYKSSMPIHPMDCIPGKLLFSVNLTIDSIDPLFQHQPLIFIRPSMAMVTNRFWRIHGSSK